MGILHGFIAAPLLFALASTPVHGAPQRAHKPVAHKKAAAPAPPALQCGDYVSFQVLLDRQGFSPGQIDGKPGTNLSHALAALQQARNVAQTGQPDCDTWRVLGGDEAVASRPTVTDYELTADDIDGPFTREIPREISKQQSLPALGYQSAIEALGEKFHASPLLLREL